MTTQQDKVRALEAQIEQLQRQWPKHSTPPALMQQLDELEEALEEARAQTLVSDHDDPDETTNSA